MANALVYIEDPGAANFLARLPQASLSNLPRKEEFNWLTPLLQNQDRVVYTRQDLRNVLSQCLLPKHQGLDKLRLTEAEQKTYLSQKASDKIIGFVKQCLTP